MPCVCLQSHLAELDADDIPEEVASQKDVVFANIKDIYGFHTRYYAIRKVVRCARDSIEFCALFAVRIFYTDDFRCVLLS